MPERRPDQRTRIDALERLEARRAQLVGRAPEREAQLGRARNPRLAITCEEYSGAGYPAEADTPNTYWIKFLDSSYALTEGAQTPTHTQRQTDPDATKPGAFLAHLIDSVPYVYVPEGTVVEVFRDNDRWWMQLFSHFRGIQWAVAQADWTDDSRLPYVSCKRCDRDGGNVRGDEFYVYLPRSRQKSLDLDPSVYADDVIGYELDEQGDAICQTDYLWSAIGDLKWIKDPDRIPTGWRECDGTGDAWDAAHRFLMARDTGGESNEVTPGTQGGFRWHGDTEEGGQANCHSMQETADGIGGAGHPDEEGDTGVTLDHSHTIAVTWAESALQRTGWTGPEGNDTDNRPPFLVAVLIERYK